ncbi:hypothetical protein HCN44_005676 [Aphidius gifuensis]|uniref:Uncharacterized protein n=1 Tax=Aphidius gifuensis TaxID=684658 RepID=A0A835CVM9_APHGI|nr:hypothetical protein HCN44_005676 [Aphidius gifuensis]
MGNMMEKSSDPEDTSEKKEPSDDVAALKALPRPDYIESTPQGVPMIQKRRTRRLPITEELYSGETGYVRHDGHLFTSSKNLKSWSRKIDLTKRRAWLLRQIAAAEPESKPSGDSTTLVKQNSSIVY